MLKDLDVRDKIKKLAKRSYIYLGILLASAFFTILFWSLYYYLTSEIVYLILYGVFLVAFLVFSILFLVLRVKMIKEANKE